MTPLLTEVRRYAERRWFSGTKQESNRLCCGMTNPELRWEVAMPLLAADPVSVLPEQREVLEQLVRTHSTPQQLAMRARMILHAADGTRVRASARELAVWPKTVRYWRNHPPGAQPDPLDSRCLAAYRSSRRMLMPEIRENSGIVPQITTVKVPPDTHSEELELMADLARFIRP